VLDLLPPLGALLPQGHGPYIALMLIGFGVGILGNLLRQRWLIAAGILLIFLGALLLPLAAGLPGTDKPPGGERALPLESGE
jgi:cytochrome c biogenesis protein CcdA